LVMVYSWHHLLLEENERHSMEKEFNSLVEGNSLVWSWIRWNS
jgi:hypothetical protein